MKIRKPKIKLKWVIISLLIAIVLIAAGIFVYKNWLSNKYFASVNGTKITLQEKQSEIDSLIVFYEYNNQTYDYGAIEQTIESNLIDSLLLKQYAEANNIVISEQDIQNYYDQRVKSAGSEQDLLNKIKDLYGYDKETYLLSIKESILRDEIQKTIDKPLNEWLKDQKSAAKIEYY